MACLPTYLRVAVAEEIQNDALAPRLGRAVRFALFDVKGEDIRGPFFRVRHDDPGQVCDEHGELATLLNDCQVVIAGAAGRRMGQRLRDLGIEVVATRERRPAAQLVARHMSGTLERAVP